MRRASKLSVALLLASAAGTAGAAACSGTLYLTIDTGSMSQAENIAAILKKHDVRATFFLANEKTVRGDFTLDDAWAEYWRARAAEGHAFGSHTFDHGYFRGDTADGRVNFAVKGQPLRALDGKALCAELDRSQTAFQRMTGRRFDPVWRAPGGHTTPNALRFAQQCGYRHVGWAPAGFLGDELPSDKYPNDMLLKRALAGLRSGDIMMMHTGIWSRSDPFAPMLDPLLGGLKARGFCFATLADQSRSGSR
jgi:peptidoglycan/xylan/chitin deacetylase (PgdA/CDA1 family)